MNYRSEFPNFEKRAGNAYKAILDIASEARRRVFLCDNHISEAEAISWIVDKELPNLSRSSHIAKASYIDEVLSEIVDKRVRISVIKSLHRTYAANQIKSNCHCTFKFVYHRSLSAAERSRVRVLTRLIYFHKDS